MHTIQSNYNMDSIRKFSIEYNDDTVIFKKIFPKKVYRKYYLVITFFDDSLEKKMISFDEKEAYKKAIFRLNYLLSTEYIK